ncbi:DUF4280 domain-containing protein [Roseomonas sp. BN140053]|uniref:DUF4280 domain-containing protein n=1 Tax=Roseomonas sp. BN140053 TaxID=3391898 RepID=UPI0039ED3002
MVLHVVDGATLKCSFGAAPSRLTVLPVNRMWIENAPAANILDHKPMVNIQPFGACSCPANPQVAAATAAALGVLTPQPCIPVTPTPWFIGSVNVTLVAPQILNDTAKCLCTWGGVITVADAGEHTEEVP